MVAQGGSVRAVRHAEQREAGVEPQPEDQVAHELVPPNCRYPPDGNKRDLRDLEGENVDERLYQRFQRRRAYLHGKQVEPYLLRHDRHNELVCRGREQEGEEHGT